MGSGLCSTLMRCSTDRCWWTTRLWLCRWLIMRGIILASSGVLIGTIHSFTTWLSTNCSLSIDYIRTLNHVTFNSILSFKLKLMHLIIFPKRLHKLLLLSTLWCFCDRSVFLFQGGYPLSHFLFSGQLPSWVTTSVSGWINAAVGLLVYWLGSSIVSPLWWSKLLFLRWLLNTLPGNNSIDLFPLINIWIKFFNQTLLLFLLKLNLFHQDTSRLSFPLDLLLQCSNFVFLFFNKPLISLNNLFLLF